MLRPGLMRRRDALTIAAKDAVKLLLGAVPMLVVAGIIEGFISPAGNIPPIFKWGVGIFSGALFYVYLLLFGHDRREKRNRRFEP
jgi:hypothetical protein